MGAQLTAHEDGRSTVRGVGRATAGRRPTTQTPRPLSTALLLRLPSLFPLPPLPRPSSCRDHDDVHRRRRPSLDGFGAGVSPEELRRLRRTISNRESARRCRLRKQRRLEELREQASVLRSENRDLSGRLGGIARRCLLVHRDNNRLLAEASALGRRLADLRRVLALHHLRRVAAPPPPLPGDYY
ncbi:unnamed protein product [Musa textilis]